MNDVERAIAELRKTLPADVQAEMQQKDELRKQRRKARKAERLKKEAEAEAAAEARSEERSNHWLPSLLRALTKAWLYCSGVILVGAILSYVMGLKETGGDLFASFFTVLFFGGLLLLPLAFITVIFIVLKAVSDGDVSAEEVVGALHNLNRNSSSSYHSNDNSSTGETYYQLQVRGGTTWLNVGGPRNEAGAINSLDYEKSRNPEKRYRVVEKRNGRIVGTVYSG